MEEDRISSSNAIQYVTVDGEQHLVKNDEVVNPLFVGSGGSTVKLMDPQTLYQTYNSVLVLCVKDGVTCDTDVLKSVYTYLISKTDMDELFKNFALFRCDLSMIRNAKHKNFANVVDGKFLQKYFPGSTFEVTEIVVPLFEMTECNARLYTSLYSNTSNIPKIQKILNLTNHYNTNYKGLVKNKMIRYLRGIESSFWENPSNCQINMTEMFVTRGFDYKEVRDGGVKQNMIASVMKETKEEKEDNIKKKVITAMATNSKEIDYIASAMNTTKSFVDIYDALKQSGGKRTYYAKTDDSKLVLNKKSILELYRTATEDFERYYILNAFLKSKDYCHLVLNNREMLKEVTPFITKHSRYYKYLMAYSWIYMYIEECIFKTKSTADSRFVFDINTAHELPVFYTCLDDVWHNPYMTLLVNKKVANINNNCNSLYGISDKKHYGVCNLEEFKKRFNIFTTGNPDKNVLDGLNWAKFAVSGSVMAGCLPKESPLIANVAKPNLIEKDKQLMFFSHYYSGSDIDLMCSTKSVYEFISNAGHVYSVLSKNISDNGETPEITVEPIKNTYVIITEHFFKECLAHLNDEVGATYTSEQIINMIDKKDEDIAGYFYDIYYDVKKSINRQIIKNSKELQAKYNFNKHILKLYTRKTPQSDINIRYTTMNTTRKTCVHGDSETCFFVNNFRGNDNKVPEDENYMVYKISESIRYKFKSPKLLRCIELFQVRGDDYFSVVGRFHFPCVRAYYKGDNVYMLPSCITSMMTGVNIEYKYFAGTNDPVKIINKYRTRGFGSIFNKKELEHIAYYNKNIDENGGMYSIKNKDSLESLTAPKVISDKIFKPSVYTNGAPEKTYVNPDYKYIKNKADLYTAYANDPDVFTPEEASPVDMFNFTAVSSDGSIYPIQPWLEDAYLKLYVENKAK